MNDLFLHLIKIGNPEFPFSEPYAAVLFCAADKIGSPHEFGDKTRLGFFINVPGRTDLTDLTITHNDNPVGQSQGLFLIMGHINQGNSEIFLQFLDHGSKPHTDFGIQRTQRLIQKQNFRFDGDRSPQRHPLLLPAAQLGRIMGSPFAEAQKIQNFGHAIIGLLFGHFAHFEAKSNILLHGHIRKERIRLKDDAKVSFLGDDIIYNLSVVQDISGGGLLKSREHSQNGGFSTPTGPQKA